MRILILFCLAVSVGCATQGDYERNGNWNRGQRGFYDPNPYDSQWNRGFYNYGQGYYHNPAYNSRFRDYNGSSGGYGGGSHNPLHVPQGRYNNLSNPSKWRL